MIIKNSCSFIFSHRFFLFVLILFLHQIIIGQDHHYWMNMGGTRSALMGGAVVGGVRDNSAGLYNPAALAFVDKVSHSISSNAYKWNNIIINDGLGKNIKFKSDQIRIIPSLVSGVFKIDFIPWMEFSYSIAAKDFSLIKVNALHHDKIDIINKIENGKYLGNNKFADIFDGPEDFSGQFEFNESLTEYWAGLSWAKKINNNLSYGITVFIVYRDQDQTDDLNIYAVDANKYQSASNQIMKSVSYYNFRLIPKFGFSYNEENIKAGLTVTIPSINLYGDATVAFIRTSRNLFQINDPESGENIYLDLIAMDRQPGLSAVYKSPLSIAAGLETSVTKSVNIGLTVEYFLGLNQYTITQPENKIFFKDLDLPQFENEFSSKNILRIVDEKKQVLNFAIGLEYQLSEIIKSYLSFRTDFRYNKNINNTINTLGICDWNIYHGSIGALYKLENQEVSLGIIGSYGSNDIYKQLVNLKQPYPQTGELFIGSSTVSTKAYYWSIGLSLGFTYYL
ncbi:MAG: hypothetical protein KKB34_18270 [Bacteroidetes bacterium]|nr:hypothetical protein [Bacteroidota bacterium]